MVINIFGDTPLDLAKEALRTARKGPDKENREKTVELLQEAQDKGALAQHKL